MLSPKIQRGLQGGFLFLSVKRGTCGSFPSSSKGWIHMLQTTRPADISSRGQASEVSCGISIFYKGLHFQSGEFFSCMLCKISLLKSIVINKEERSDSEQDLQTNHK